MRRAIAWAAGVTLALSAVIGSDMATSPVAADCGMGPPGQYAAGYRGIAFIGTVTATEVRPDFSTVLTVDVERPILGVDTPTLTIVSGVKGNCSYFWGDQLAVGDRFLLAYQPVPIRGVELPEGATYVDDALIYRPTTAGWRFARGLTLHPELFPERARKADTLAEILAYLHLDPPPTDAEPAPLPSPMVAVSSRGETEDDLFRLTIEASGTTFTVGEPIPVTTTLAYIGTAPSMTVTTSGNELVGYRIKQLDGPFVAETIRRMSCEPEVFASGEVRTVTFTEGDSGGDASLWSPWLDDLLTDPAAGIYTIEAVAEYDPAGCGRGTSLTASVTIVVVDTELGPDASPLVIVIPTGPPAPAGQMAVCATAQLLGTLVSDGRWGVAIVSSTDGRTVKVTWPNGWSARRDGTGLALVDPTGTVVAHEGDRVELGGGEDASGDWHTCGDPGLVVLP